jgi:autotransporter family porin
MSKTGAGRLRAIANLSSSSTPVAVSEGILEVSGTGKLPNAATSVASGATLQLGTSGGTVVPGAVANASVASGGIMSILAGATGAVTSADISSGGIVSVAAGVTAPSGMFTSATFRSGGILQVGDGATLGQSFTSVP